MNTPALRKTYQYKVKPTPAQAQALDAVLWRCRELYNAPLEERRTAYQRRGVSLSLYEQQAELPDLKAALPAYAEINAQVLQDVLARLDKAYQAFFRRLQAGKKAGYPRFQGRNRYHSFTYKQVGEHGGARLDNGFLVLSKIGRIAVRWSRPLEGMPKTVTISREADGWYVSFSCVEVPTQPLPLTGQETGIDLGLESYLTCADGSQESNPRHHRRGEKHLKQCQRRVSCRKQGSTRRRKAVTLLARAHQKVRRQRGDFQHKTALGLVRAYDVIYHEDLQVRNMVKNHHLAKSIADAGWVQFRSILDAKAAYAERRVVAVPAQYTSQDCSGCGERVPKALSVRTHVCRNCGLVLDHDENAARNIQWAGQALQGLVAQAAGLN